MAFVIADRVRETSTTTGTGNFTLAGAVDRFRTFDSVLDTGDTTYYTIADQSGVGWEVGIATFTSPATLARTTILSSSNGGSAVDFGAGSKDVFITLPASRTVTSVDGGSTGLTPSTASYGAISLGGTLVAANGGTGQSSYTIGDLLYASGTTALSKLADVATGNALLSGGVGTAPSWGKIGLTTHVSGTLPVANGGTGTATAFTTGSVVFAGASGVYSQDNSNLFWDDTNNRLGVGTATPVSSIETNGTITAPTLAATNLKHASSASNNIVLDSSGNATFAGTPVPGSSFLRNRIINGDMRIDQRNAGASVTIASTGSFGVDRWYAIEDTDGTMTMQQSTTAPAGFVNSMVFTTGTADASLAAAQYVVTGQQIEGVNVADLGWGTASAQSVTLSFWVRSSLTGTFGGAVRNSASNRSYPFTYSISVANTWEQKAVTISGDTSGTWLTDTGVGIRLTFGLGVGSTYSGTAGSWSGSNFFSVTGATSVIGTASATWYVTGVQLEVGTAATPFERRQYGQELALCQRYFQKTFDQATAPAQNAGGNGGLTASGSVTNVSINASWWFTCPMRAVPTIVTFAPDQASANWSDQGGARPTAAVTSTGQSSVGIRGQTSVFAGGYYIIQATAAAEL